MERVTVRELSQLRYLKREIELERERLARLRERAGFVRASLSATPRARTVGDRLGEFATEIAYLEKLIEQNMQRAICELLKLQRFINEIPDSDTRQIFLLRYVKGKSWAAIAFSLELAGESTARNRHDVYLKQGRSVRRGSRRANDERASEAAPLEERGSAAGACEIMRWQPKAAESDFV